MVHCTKGQVGNVLPRMAKRVPAPRRFVHRFRCYDCRSFQTIIVQTGGWWSREDTASGANFLFVNEGDRAEISRLVCFNGEGVQLPALVLARDDAAFSISAVQ